MEATVKLSKMLHSLEKDMGGYDNILDLDLSFGFVSGLFSFGVFCVCLAFLLTFKWIK